MQNLLKTLISLKSVFSRFILSCVMALIICAPYTVSADMFLIPAAGDRASLYLAPKNTPAYIQNISETYKQRIEDFIAVAKSGDALRLETLVSETSRTTLGRSRLERLLRHEVSPFFAEHDYLDNASAYNPAGSSASISGYWFDLYSIDLDGEKRPFSIVVVREKAGYSVANIIVNRCRANRHPFCPSGYRYR